MKKDFSVTDLHHEVLRFWATWRREHDFMPSVLTLDHHTDVVQAFRNESIVVPEGAWRSEECVERAVAELKHDEHFDWAVRSGLIKEAFIASHTNATAPANGALHICMDPRWGEENDLFREPERLRPLADSVLESDYLYRCFGDIEKYGRFILDIDCDYFLTVKALSPQDDSYFRMLCQKAEIITVSLEKDWVRLLRFRGEEFSAERIVQSIAVFAAD